MSQNIVCHLRLSAPEVNALRIAFQNGRSAAMERHDAAASSIERTIFGSRVKVNEDMDARLAGLSGADNLVACEMWELVNIVGAVRHHVRQHDPVMADALEERFRPYMGRKECPTASAAECQDTAAA